MANTRLIEAIRQYCPDDQKTQDAIEGIEYLDSLFPNPGDAEEHVERAFYESIREIKIGSLERKLSKATTLEETVRLTAMLNDARNLRPPTPYEDYLRSPEWLAKRAWAIDRAEGRCQVCNKPDGLNVHHRTYKNLGAELPGDLLVLCSICHDLFHQAGRLAASIEGEYEATLQAMRQQRTRREPAA